MTIGVTWRTTPRRIKRLKEGVLTISPDYSDRDPRLFGALLQTVTSDNVTTSDGRVMPTTALLHVDQGISVTSHASQGKTVDNVNCLGTRGGVCPSQPGATLCFDVPRSALYAFVDRLQRSVARSCLQTK